MDKALLINKIQNSQYKKINKLYKILSLDEIEYINNLYIDSKSFKESIYRLLNNIDIRPICKTCGKNVEFCRGGYFRNFCSIKCSRNNKECENKRKETCIKNMVN